MKLIMIADTHDRHLALEGAMPEGDVLIHAGDLTMDGTMHQMERALGWLNRQPYEHVIMIAGNHDFCFEKAEKKAKLNFGRIIYLENTYTHIEGVKFYGMPQQPTFGGYAFNVDRGPHMRRYTNAIPLNTDVLITHGPPKNILDRTDAQYGGQCVGCEDLRNRVEVVKPKVHVFGHIHPGRGILKLKDTVFYNAAICDPNYMPAYKPFEHEL